MSNKPGYRGYVSSRTIRNVATPQRVQNLVIRDYASRKKINYLLSSTEFAMPGCYMMMEDLLKELPKLEGIILFSAFMLPKAKEKRLRIYEKIIENQCILHSALDDMVLRTDADIGGFEDVIEVVNTLPLVPLNDVYQHFSPKMDQDDPFVKAIFDSI